MLNKMSDERDNSDSWDNWGDDDFKEPESKCVCGKELIFPSGRENSKVLIVGEFPGKEELKAGKPFVGASGKIFKAELRRLGYDLNEFRVINLWMHEQNKEDICLQFGIQNVMKEAQGKRAILLVGSEVVKQFTEYDVSDVNGLKIETPYFSAPVVYAMFNPAIVFHKPIGEIRFALEKFILEIEKHA